MILTKPQFMNNFTFHGDSIKRKQVNSISMLLRNKKADFIFKKLSVEKRSYLESENHKWIE